MMEFILASNNLHKAQELSELLKNSPLKVLAAPEKLEVIEDGTSFTENAFKKAQAYFKAFKRPTLADDSGLIVDALPGELGLHSARFGGEGLSALDRCILLLEKLKGVEDIEKRTARFVCFLCFYLSPQEIYFFEGKVEGHIGYELKGEGGFGYDPLFLPLALEGRQTLAQATDWKEKNSHRAQACLEAMQFFKERDCQKTP